MREIISSNRFDDFFESRQYVSLKNLFYNYLLRKRAVEKEFVGENITMALEVGSGISPMVTFSERVIYTDLSFPAVDLLRQSRREGFFVVADVMHLPFKKASFSHVIASEVLEHVRDDRRALREMAATLNRFGCLIVTIPHCRFYFANDDVYVGHYRRYEINEISNALEKVGLRPVAVRKVLGPLEKATMMAVVWYLSLLRESGTERTHSEVGTGCSKAFVSLFGWLNQFYAALARVDAALMPRCFSSVLLIKAEKRD